MLKSLRLALALEFEEAVRNRWPQFSRHSAEVVHPKFPGEFLMFSNSTPNIKLAWSVYPNPKSQYSSFMISLLWTRSGDFSFQTSRRSTIYFGPPDYDLRETIIAALPQRITDLDMGVLWMAGGVNEFGVSRRNFNSFPDHSDYPWFPLRPTTPRLPSTMDEAPGFAQDASIGGELSIDEGRRIARPIVQELMDNIYLLVWPLIEELLIPLAAKGPWPVEEGANSKQGEKS